MPTDRQASPERALSKADEVAGLVMRRFEELPRKRKPAVRDTGVREWTTLSGIVAEREGEMRCICLATGVKCLPASKVRVANGNGIHDWHAEVLAMRALNHFLLTECRAILESPAYDSFVVTRGAAGGRWPFEVRAGVRLYMYASEAPCGDASMELTMSAQEDPTPWSIPPPPSTTTPATAEADADADAPPAPSLPGREYFSRLGIVRRKPSRPDAPPSLSKSCSDKLALWQATSLLSSLTSLLVAPAGAYLSGIVVPEPSFVPAAFARCFVDRMAPLRASMAKEEERAGGYSYAEMEPLTTRLPFEFSRQSGDAPATSMAPCNVSAVWTPVLEEGLVGGVLQGKKAFADRGASAVSRRGMWVLAREVAGALAACGGDAGPTEALAARSYGELKATGLLEGRRRVKRMAREEALKGWVRNTGGEEFGLEVS
ncbi:related to tRNA-specific adenosine deaminase 1 [Cephalotrichum gorgonifer]|uniref:Related to tRNA-specific adenosine deaminase 1 n=1 Tax=Cephalotrichum gorgonifer TaxID=2041049 RepID=A0AAE8ST69_9PEZI|nr:related to tRNA-specific adenosine deaminase 1 [Cephalotrichum gorgonifer]